MRIFFNIVITLFMYFPNIFTNYFSSAFSYDFVYFRGAQILLLEIIIMKSGRMNEDLQIRVLHDVKFDDII